MVNKQEPGVSNPNATDAGTGGDAWADFGLTAKRRVDPNDTIKWDDPLAGNFRELRSLRKKYPNLKVFISLGGWTWSRWFSNAASTDALRKQLVKSCINIYIKGNLPIVDEHGANIADGRGGPGAAADIFDGIDIDWEYPGIAGQPYNTVSADDKKNYTLLLAEFRSQLDALAKANNRKYYLTSTVVVGKDKIDQTEPAKYSKSVDWINMMSYDFHGSWEETGPTDFQANLYGDKDSPHYLDAKTGKPGVEASYNIDAGVTNLINAGVPASKLVLGIPFYGRGWTGVGAGPNSDGLYQPATGPATGKYEKGIEDYKVLKDMAVGTVKNADGTTRSVNTTHYHPVTKQLWTYDGTNFWSYDDATVIQTKIDYAKSKSLGGVMSWSIDGDDAQGTLLDAMSRINQ